jgi:hypothetical protein
MKQYLVQFVSGITWNVEAIEALPAVWTDAKWKVYRLDYREHEPHDDPELARVGTWIIAMNNVEGLREA